MAGARALARGTRDQSVPACCPSLFGLLSPAVERGHEWRVDVSAQEEEGLVVKDASGTLLNDGDAVTVIKGSQGERFIAA